MIPTASPAYLLFITYNKWGLNIYNLLKLFVSMVLFYILFHN